MAIDYNPDKERQVDHKWIVVNNAPKERDAVVLDNKVMKFNKDGAFYMRDGVQAHTLEDVYGTDVVVTRVRASKHADRGHRFFFGQMPEMPWKILEE
jgi:hypothetical protein